MSYTPNTDEIIDGTHTWNNRNDQVEFERAFQQGTIQEKLMAIALYCADPATPENRIRRQGTAPMPPSRFGYSKIEPTLDDAFAGFKPPDPSSMMDYSGNSNNVPPTQTNNLTVW